MEERLQDQELLSPMFVEYGSLLDLTAGDGTSDIWDMGSGREKD